MAVSYANPWEGINSTTAPNLLGAATPAPKAVTQPPPVNSPTPPAPAPVPPASSNPPPTDKSYDPSKPFDIKTNINSPAYYDGSGNLISESQKNSPSGTNQVTTSGNYTFTPNSDGTFTSKNNVTGQTVNGVTSPNEESALSAEKLQKSTDAFNKIIGYQNGSIPLTPGEQAQVDDLKRQYQSLISEQQLTNKNNENVNRVQGFRGGGEYTPGIESGRIADIITRGASKVADLTSKMSGAVAKLESGFRTDDINAIKDAYALYDSAAKDRLTEIQTQKEFVQNIAKEQADAKAKVDAEFQTEKNKLLTDAATAGADPSIINSIKDAPDYNSAFAAYAKSPVGQNALLDAQYKKAQIAKIYSDIANSDSTAGGKGDPSLMIAYAQEFAETGKIPTGIPKGSFGTISQIAQELPKNKGQILSRSTGVSPSSDPTLQTAMGSLYSAIELAKQLKTLDDERWGGLVSGTLGKITGSEAQSRYVNLRAQIVDLLGRARSGAVLNPSEEELYSSMLPGRFSNPLGLGQDSGLKIDSFINSLTSDLQNKADIQGWVINGFSKVNLGGKEYTVGDVVTAGNGSKGRINANGTITLINE